MIDMNELQTDPDKENWLPIATDPDLTNFNAELDEEFDAAILSSPMKLVFPKMISPLKEFSSPSRYFLSPQKSNQSPHRTAPSTLPQFEIGHSPASSTSSLLLSPLQIHKQTSTPRAARTPIRKRTSALQQLKSPTDWLQGKIDQEPGTESFLSFVHTLSPLVEMKNYEANSPLATRVNCVSPATAAESIADTTKTSLTKLTPPFLSPDSSVPSNFLCSSSISIRKVAQKLDFGEESITNLSIASKPGTPSNIPQIKASTSATPGKEQRSMLGKRSNMKLQIRKPGESTQAPTIRTINENLRSEHTPRATKKLRVSDAVSTPTSQRHPLLVESSPSEYRSPQVSVYRTAATIKNSASKPPMKKATSNKSKARTGATLSHPASKHSKKINKIPNSTSRVPIAKPKLLQPPVIPTTPYSSPHLQQRRTTSSMSSMKVCSHSKQYTPSLRGDNFLTSPLASSISPKTTATTGDIITPTKKRNPCKCKKSKCLKLYCECFAAGSYCTPACKCTNCANTHMHEPLRKDAIASTLARNPNAFEPKFLTSAQKVATHNTGCHCKKSACLKKYCECFQAGINCGPNCKCTECKNHDGVDHMRLLTNSSKKASHLSSKPKLPPSLGPKSALVAAKSIHGASSVSNLLHKNRQYFRLMSTTSPVNRITTKVSVSKYASNPERMTFRPSPKQLIAAASAAASSSSTLVEKSGSRSKITKDPIPVFVVFGKKAPPLKREVVTKIFSYLENAELYTASQVNKLWSSLAMDGSLWEYPPELQPLSLTNR